MAKKNILNNQRNCPICKDTEDNEIFLSKKIDESKITDFSFSSRKEPEFMRHQLVRCLNCDLVYANQPPSENSLHESYHEADYDSDIEANDAANVYFHLILEILENISGKNTALEIGTGNGIFLDYLSKAGFQKVIGIEPSLSAIKSAPPERQKKIQEGIFDENNYKPESFDLICCFMTMEHVLDPKIISDSVFQLLKPGGAFVTITHNYRSLINKLLGKKSPIIDIEHMQVFSNISIVNLMEESNYININNKDFKNRYRIIYWIRLLPIPSKFKEILYEIIKKIGLKEYRLSINVGNQITSAYKP